jgi:2,3-bisphosphoglycerate-independent phosphoglycerate mutase
VLDLMNTVRGILSAAAMNEKRKKQQKRPATDIWLWGQGGAVNLPSLQSRFGISGSVISAVDLIRGLGILAGLSVRIVEGATGYLGTNYRGKVDAAYAALADKDFVFLHVEAPDETSHEGSLEKKIRAIEEFDREIVGPVCQFRTAYPDLKILVLPDHATPITLKTHHRAPVPFAISGADVEKDKALEYNEESAATAPVISGEQLFSAFIK